MRGNNRLRKSNGQGAPRRGDDNNRITPPWRRHHDGNAFELKSAKGMMMLYWDIVSEVAASSRKTRVLTALASGALDQRNIARLCSLERSNAHRALNELCRAGLAACLTPQRPRAKVYEMTELGKQVHGQLDQGRWRGGQV